MKARKRVSRRSKVVRIRAQADWKSYPQAQFAAWERPAKKRVTMFIDADVLAWLRNRGRWYQKEINQILRG